MQKQLGCRSVDFVTNKVRSTFITRFFFQKRGAGEVRITWYKCEIVLS